MKINLALAFEIGYRVALAEVVKRGDLSSSQLIAVMPLINDRQLLQDLTRENLLVAFGDDTPSVPLQPIPGNIPLAG